MRHHALRLRAPNTIRINPNHTLLKDGWISQTRGKLRMLVTREAAVYNENL